MKCWYLLVLFFASCATRPDSNIPLTTQAELDQSARAVLMVAPPGWVKTKPLFPGDLQPVGYAGSSVAGIHVRYEGIQRDSPYKKFVKGELKQVKGSKESLTLWIMPSRFNGEPYSSFHRLTHFGLYRQPVEYVGHNAKIKVYSDALLPIQSSWPNWRADIVRQLNLEAAPLAQKN